MIEEIAKKVVPGMILALSFGLLGMYVKQEVLFNMATDDIERGSKKNIDQDKKIQIAYDQAMANKEKIDCIKGR